MRVYRPMRMKAEHEAALHAPSHRPMSSPGYSSARLRPRRAGLRFTRYVHLTKGFIQHRSCFGSDTTFLLLPSWSAHAEAEEKVFYPLLKAEFPDQVDEALQEHMEVKEMLVEILDMEFNDEDFDSKFTAMIKAVQHHVEEEERDGGIMDIARQKINEENLTTMASDIEAIKRAIQDEMAV
jgi:Hemerythrin HHE cation binding domain